MIKSLFEFIKTFIPYKNNGKNNNIYVVFKGKEKKLKRRIKGLNIKFSGDNNTVKLHLPLKFKDTRVYLSDNSTFEILSTTAPIIEWTFSLGYNCHIFINSGCKLNKPNGRVIINNNRKEIPNNLHIGKNAQVSRDVLIRTSDGHSLFNLGETLPYNTPRDITIGDNVWIGSRVVLLKGSILQDNTVVGACSVVNKKFDEKNIIIAGHPAKIVKRNIEWRRENYGQCFEKTIQSKKSEKQILISKIKRKQRELMLKSF